MSDFDANAFDPEAFLAETTDEVGSTAYTPCPEGEHIAIIEKVEKPRVIERKDGEGHSVIMNISYSISGQPANEELGQDPIRVRQGVFLDMKGSSLDMGKGKNITLNRIREAVNQNTAGPWSPARLEGQGPVKILVKHRADRDGNPQADVARVGKPND